MVNSEKQRSVDDREIEGNDRVDRANDNCFDDSTPAEAFGIGTSSEVSGDGGGSDLGFGITDRLADILVDEGDGDLSLFQQSDRGEMVFQFLQALDFQVMGACRADERLKPLLKLNLPGGAAEDCLLSNLSQHFEPSEVGMLARCLCVPLVSIRVGKINKQGTLLCPTATRGNLTLTLLPTSDFRISFIGDDGHSERLSTLSSDSRFSAVTIEEIPVDKSGRSFLMKMPDGKVFYFWCSEKSKLLGNELLAKMKDLLNRRPSLAELTGISELHLNCFVTHLRTYPVGSTVQNNRASSVVGLNHPLDSSLDSSELCQTSLSSSPSSKPLRSRHLGSQAGKSNSLYQGGLSPRSSSFKEGLPRSSSSVRSLAREEVRRWGDGPFSVVDGLPVAPQASTNSSVLNNSVEARTNSSVLNNSGEGSIAMLCGSSPNLLEFGKSGVPAFVSPTSQVPVIGSFLFSTHYCWCPPVASTLQYMVTPPQVPISLIQSLSLPPLSSLLPATGSFSTVLMSAPVNMTDIPLDFPPLLSDPLVRLPLSKSSPQQIPSFKPLICDPIVHIPVIDVCSSGQGYLVSAGPAISTTIPSLLHSSVVNPLIPKTDSAVEESARETLNLLIATSSQSNSQRMMVDVLPSLLTTTGERQNITGSRGLYSGSGGDEGFISKQRKGGSDR